MEAKADRTPYVHDAFISYSRKNRDFAVRLEKALEDYVPPKDLNVPQRHLDIFRDETDFTGAEYHRAVDMHLQTSSKLIVICSPDARKSLYVNDEIRRFAHANGADNIVPILLAGIPNNEVQPGQEADQAFPDALCEALEMPLAQNYLNFDTRRDRVNRGAYDGSWYATLANLYGVSRSVIEQRDRKRQARRRRIAAGLVTGVIAALLAALAVTLVSRRQALSRLAELYEEQGRQELSRGNNEQALAYLNEAYSVGADRNSLHYLIAQAARPLGVPRISINDGQKPIREAAFSPDNRLVITLSTNGTAQVWDAKTGSVLTRVGSDDADGIDAATFSPDAKRFLVLSRSGKPSLCRVDNGKSQIRLGDPSGGVRAARFSPDGGRVLTEGPGPRLELWDSDDGKQVASLQGQTADIESASFSADGSTIAAVAGGKILVWDGQTGASIRSFAGPDDSVKSVALSGNGGKILTLTARGAAQLWDSSATPRPLVQLGGVRGSIVVQAQTSADGARLVARTESGGLLSWDAVGGILEPPDRNHGWILCATLSPDGSRIAYGTDSGWAGVLDAATGHPVVSLVGHTIRVRAIAFSTDGKHVLTGSDDRTARIWDAETGKLVATLAGHRDAIISVAFSSDGKQSLTVSADGSAKLWDVPPNVLLSSWKASTKELAAAAFSPDGNRLVSAGYDNTARVWNVGTGLLESELKGHENLVIGAIFTEDGKRVITGSYDETVRIWETKAAPKEMMKLAGHGWQLPGLVTETGQVVGAGGDWFVRIWDGVRTTPQSVFRIPGERREVVSLSRDGIFVAGPDADETVTVWRIADGKLVTTLKGDTERLRFAAFSPDSRRILLIRENNVVRHYRTAKIWDIAGRWPLVSLEEGVDLMQLASFSGDGKLIASGHSDGTVRVWDTETGRVLGNLSDTGSSVSAVAFSRDSQRVVVGRRDGLLQIWDVRLDTRTREQLDNLVKQRVPFQLRDGQLLPVAVGTAQGR